PPRALETARPDSVVRSARRAVALATRRPCSVGRDRAEFGSSSQHTRPITGPEPGCALHEARPCLAVCMRVAPGPRVPLACRPRNRPEFAPDRPLFPGNDVVEDISQKLLQAHIIDETALQKAALQQKTAGGSITGNLVKIGALTEEQLLEFLAKLFGCPAIDLKNFEPDPALTRLLPGDVASKFLALPVSKAGRRLVVAMEIGRAAGRE